MVNRNSCKICGSDIEADEQYCNRHKPETRGWHLECCNEEVDLDFLLEGQMPNQDGSLEYSGICSKCGTVFYLKLLPGEL